MYQTAHFDYKQTNKQEYEDELNKGFNLYLLTLSKNALLVLNEELHQTVQKFRKNGFEQRQYNFVSALV